MFNGDSFTILKGYLVNNIKIQFDSNGIPFTYFIVNSNKFTNSHGKKEYQPIKVLAKGNFVKTFIEPYIKKKCYLEMIGAFHFKYKTNEQGYPDVNKIEDYFFRLDKIWEHRSYQDETQRNTNQSPNPYEQDTNQNENQIPLSNNQQEPIIERNADPFQSYIPAISNINNAPFGETKKTDLDSDLPF
jgi:hypothetical protein